RRIGPAIMRVVVDAQNGAVFQSDPRRALDLRKQHVDLAAQPANFQMPTVERTVLDLATVVIRQELAAANTPPDLHAFARKSVAKLETARNGKVGRTAVKRPGELAGRHPPPLHGP